MKITLFNVISQDGFVATKDRKEDFIPDELWDSFIKICNKHDVLIWGKNTYEAFKKYDQPLVDQFAALPIGKVILTKDKNYIPELPFTSIHSVDDVSSLGQNILVSGSATLNDLFINKNLVDEIVVNILPVALVEGIPQFTTNPELSLISENQYQHWVERIYKLAK